MATGLEYEWDENKRRVNIAKHHGVEFTAMVRFEWDTAVIDFDNNHPEPRWIAMGFIGDVLHLVVYTERGKKNPHYQPAKGDSEGDEGQCPDLSPEPSGRNPPRSI